jgi:hypothetical protein
VIFVMGTFNYLDIAGAGGLSVLLRVPRPSASSLICAKRSDSPLLGVWYLGALSGAAISQQQGVGPHQSEAKGEDVARRTRTAVCTPTLLRAQRKMRPLFYRRQLSFVPNSNPVEI